MRHGSPQRTREGSAAARRDETGNAQQPGGRRRDAVGLTAPLDGAPSQRPTSTTTRRKHRAVSFVRTRNQLTKRSLSPQ